MPTPFAKTLLYNLTHGHITGIAVEASDPSHCEKWLGTEVKDRVHDQPMIEDFKAELSLLQADGFDISALQVYETTPPTEVTLGDIGESIADLFLMEQMSAYLPTNRRRDLRTPKGSHPGADIVGYVPDGAGGTMFMFGEIKASSDTTAPPGVMTHTDSGMVAQLTRLAERVPIRRQLLFYLRDRAQKVGQLQSHYRPAMQALALSKMALVGVLVRDTQPTEQDVNSPMAKLHTKIPAQQPCNLFVLHTNVPSAQWLLHCNPI